jgi:hypothetical protein
LALFGYVEFEMALGHLHEEVKWTVTFITLGLWREIRVAEERIMGMNETILA